MMDFNEKLMEAQMDTDQKQVDALKMELSELEKSFYAEVSEILNNYNPDQITESELNSLKQYYFKRKYLLRIKENLDRFAST